MYTENLTARLLENRRIEFYNDSDEVIFTMASPYMYDSGAELSEDIAVEMIEKGDGCYFIKMTPDAQWLNDESRVYPVVIDPEVSTDTTQQNIIDNYVLEGSGVQNNNLDRLYIGNKSGSRARAYIQFAAMPTIPSGSTITAATMTVQILAGTSTANTASAYMVTGADWASGTITWDNKPAAATTLATNISHNSKTKYSFSCKTAVQTWYSGSTTGQNKNYGVMMQYYDEDIADYNSVYSADYSDESKRPAITITYQLPTDSIADGVYRIKNTHIGLYLGTYGSIAENTSVKMLAYSNEGLSMIQQLWKITYLGSGYYSIRPMHKLDMGLHATNYTVDITTTTGPNDTLSDVVSLNRWSIVPTSDGTGYNLNNVGTNSMAMRYADGATSPGLGVITAVNPGTSNSFKWALELVPGVYLYDSTYSLTDSSEPVEIEMGGTYTLSDMGITLVTSGVSGTEWSSNDTSVISVDEYSGTATANKRGDATITVSAWASSTQYTAQICISSVETIYVKNYYDSTVSGDTAIINNISVAVDFADQVYRDEFNLRFVMDGSPVQYSNAPVDVCTRGDQLYCAHSNETNCASDCREHHKNVHRIADELSPTQSNRLVVTWSNCKEGIFCTAVETTTASGGVAYKHEENYTDLALVTFEEVGDTRVFAPVVQFLTIDQNSLLSGNESDVAFMSITLAHEIAHTLGMSDVYNNYFYPNITGHTSYIDTRCIMSSYTLSEASNFYKSIFAGDSAFCTDCVTILNDEMSENV